jgi:hypothetical protein
MLDHIESKIIDVPTGVGYDKDMGFFSSHLLFSKKPEATAGGDN